MAKINPLEFMRQVRQEASKVTWPTRRETSLSTGMVFIFVTMAGLFFFAVDQVFSTLVKVVFGLGA